MDLENTPHRDPEVIELSKTVLHQIQTSVPTVVYATVVTEDGFEVASISTTIPLTDDGKVAAMVSSISALSEAISASLELETSESIVISASNGTFVVKRVAGTPLIIAGVFAKQELLGKALVSVGLATAELRKSLNLR